MRRSVKTQAMAGLKWSAFSKIYTSIASLLQVSFLARYLSKDEFGLIGIAILVNGFCGIFTDMGLTTAAMHDNNLTKQKLSSYFWLNITLGFILSVSAALFSPLVASYYKKDELVDIISLTSILIFIHSLSCLQRTIQQKQMNFRFMSVVEIVASTIGISLTIIFAIKGLGIYSFVWAQILSGVFVALIYLTRILLYDHNVTFYFNYLEIRNALKIGVYQVCTYTVDFLAREMDSLIVSSNLSMEIFGVYTLCKNLSMRVYVVMNPIITNVLTPVLVKMQDDFESLCKTYKRTVEVVGYVNFILYTIFAVCSSSILVILYGNSYYSYSFVLFYMSMFYAFHSLGNPVGSLIVATGRTDRGLYWTIFKVVFSLFYLHIASLFELRYFMVFVALFPIITLYPNWRILLSYISNLSFKDLADLNFKPFLACCPLLPFFYLDGIIDNPVISVLFLSIICIVSYYIINFFFRPQIQKYIVGTIIHTIINRR